MYSTTASGPLSTWRPLGSENVLRVGITSLAMDMILSASSGVHMDAVNLSFVNGLWYMGVRSDVQDIPIYLVDALLRLP